MVFRRWAIVASACLLLLVLLAGYKFFQIRQMIAFAESFPEPSATVETVTASVQPWQDTSKTVGEVLAPQALSLRNEVEGRVVAVGFIAGEPVRKDQMLVQLDASEEIARLRAAEADAELAQLSLERFRKLNEQRLASHEQYDQARAQFAVAQAQAQSLRAVIDKKTLTAPFDGRAGLHHLQTGQYLAANTVITELVGDSKTLWVDFSLPQQLAQVATGTTVNVTANGILAAPAAGHVIAVDPLVSSTSRNIRLRAQVDNSSLLLKPGMLVDVLLQQTVSSDVLAVPATAVQYDKTGAYVFVMQTDAQGQQRARLQRIAIAQEQSGMIRVTEGLQAGETIATNGAYKLQDGMLAHTRPAEASHP